MAKRSGRPQQADSQASRQSIIDAAVRIIKRDGAEAVTLRNVCREAGVSNGTFYFYFKNKDDLLMHFLRETSFDSFALSSPVQNISERSAELYMILINRYMDLGLDFMKSFYSTGNKPLSAYLGEQNGAFPDGTIMARNESDIVEAKALNVITADADPHTIAMDVCTIVKGCVFEWCLTDGNMDIQSTLTRILHGYFKQYLK